MPAAMGVAYDVPDLYLTKVGFVVWSQRWTGHADSTASPMVAKLVSSAMAVGLNLERFPFASVEWIQMTFWSRAGYARSRFAPLLDAAANRRTSLEYASRMAHSSSL